MAATAGVVNAANLSLEESILADTSNISEEESQRLSTQTRAAVYYLGNKGVTEQQAKERFQMSHSTASDPQQRPPPPPSPPTSSPPAPPQPPRKPLAQATAALIKASSSTVVSAMDRPRAMPVRARTTALTPRPLTMAQPQQPKQQQESVESDPGFRPGSYVPGGRDDYWYRTSHAARLAQQDESDTSSTPPKSQSQPKSPPKQQQSESQSQTQSQSQSQPKPSQIIQSPPASPPRQTGLVKMLSQLSTSDTCQERGVVLVPATSDQKDHSGDATRPSGIVDYASDQSNMSIQIGCRPDETQPTQLQTPLNYLFPQPTPSDSHCGSSPSLGGSPRRPSPSPSPRSSPSLGGNDRRSSPSLGGPSPTRPGAFGALNMTGGSSPYPASSAFPTQNPESLTQEEEDDSGVHHHDSGETQATAPTQLVTPETHYVSATPIPPSARPPEEEGDEGNSGEQTGSGGDNAQGEGTLPTQLNDPEQPDVNMHDANPVEDVSLQSPPNLITPHRTEDFVRQGNTSPSRPHVAAFRSSPEQSPTRALTTPLTNPHQPYALDRSRKSAFEPPVRTRPEAQLPIPRPSFGGRELSGTQTRWDASRAEEESPARKAGREGGGRLAQSRERQAESSAQSRERERPTSKPQTPGADEVLTASTPFVSGKGKGTPQRLVRSPISPQRAGARELEGAQDTQMEDAHDTEPEDAEPQPTPQTGPLVRNESSLPLELGRQKRLKEGKQPTPAPQPESEAEHESEEDAPPHVTPPSERGKQTARRGGRGRGRGRGRGGASGTPRTPHEDATEPASPPKSGPSTGKKRPRGGTAGDVSPMGTTVKKPRVQPGPSTRATAASTPAPISTGTRVLAWWSRGKNYYFASITGRVGKGRCTVRFDDNDNATIALDKLHRAELRIGDRVKIYMHDKNAAHQGDAIVKDIRKWQSDRVVNVATGTSGDGKRLDVPSAALMIQTKEVKSSWSDRLLDADEIVVPTDSNVPTKRKVNSTATPTPTRSGAKLAGYAFVLTLKAEDVGIREDRLEEWKAALRAKIEDQGGVIANEWDELFVVKGNAHSKGWTFQAGEGAVGYVGGNKWGGIHKIFLLSGKAGTTAKYMMALALGVPCLSHKWVDDFLLDESTSWLHALLTGGQSDRYGTLVSQVLDPRVQTEPDMVNAIVESQSARRPFEGKTVLCIFKRAKKVQKDASDKGKFFSRVICVLGAASVHLIHDFNPWPLDRQPDDFDFVVCETPSTQNVLEGRGATCRSVDWVKQCIIMGRALPADD
ncbi:hypothetical protein FRC10_001134 [Ceratobasidium sp. 414]|nr:hypothetical protein FRC10_001134 [Ceratobasidium sp. 414]